MNNTVAKTKDYSPWSLVKIYASYRLALALLLLAIRYYNVNIIGNNNPMLFSFSMCIYLLSTVIALIPVHQNINNYSKLTLLQIIIDIGMVTLVIHSSGGISSGFGVLMLPIVAAGSLLTPGRVSFLYTAIACIAILVEQLYAYAFDIFKQPVNFPQAGFSGIILFATAIAINILSKKLGYSEKIILQQIEKIEDFTKLNSMIIQLMHTGIIVINPNDMVTLANQSAMQLLSITTPPTNKPLKQINPTIYQLASSWRQHTTYEPYIIQGNNNIELGIDFISLENDKHNNIIIIIDDLNKQKKHFQETKLISLGRLTASIAHEIRNPLGGIGHAAQLLHESSNLNAADTRLLNIIQENINRTNLIIENILLLSRSKHNRKKKINLSSWLNHFKKSFITSTLQPIIKLDYINSENIIFFDETQLQQVLNNLCENGIRYSNQHINKPIIELSINNKNQQTILQIKDFGPGISEEDQKYLFEPFFTTSPNGTGLGLFIASQLCKANNAELQYIKISSGSIFQINFNPQILT